MCGIVIRIFFALLYNIAEDTNSVLKDNQQIFECVHNACTQCQCNIQVQNDTYDTTAAYLERFFD